jgi:hypothetical protein
MNRLWQQIGAAMANVVGPAVIAVLFFLVLTPMAGAMRLAGRRPLRLATDPTAPSYWIERQSPQRRPSSMRRQL